MKILLANPRGFCAGVNRAIEIVERALDLFGSPVYVRHEVVHNRFVVKTLVDKGAIFVEELTEIPDRSIVIFSAHGVSKEVEDEAVERNLRIFDATCPLVTKVHIEVVRHQMEKRECILIGHAGHPEVEGTLGRYRQGDAQMYLVETVADVARLDVKDPSKLSYVTQTTLSVDDTVEIIAALRARFPRIEGPKKDDICYATQNRQDAVKDIAAKCELMFVVGSKNSSNSNRLRELAQRMGIPAYLIDTADDIETSWLHNVSTIGVTAGASAPNILVTQVIDRLVALSGGDVQEIEGITENVQFSLPRELKGKPINKRV
ncbi:MAG: 4-hydroxy-3-methylbut-2-enyl diphosphate reductase [Thiohalomonadales bacterium]